MRSLLREQDSAVWGRKCIARGKGRFRPARRCDCSGLRIPATNGVVRYYNPVLGRWLNADPLGENGGFNLHAFCGNDGANRIDPWGMDFIALAERPLEALQSLPEWGNEVGGLAQHSSIEYWESDCPSGKNVEWRKEEFRNASRSWHVEWLDSAELLTDGSPWRIWQRRPSGYPGASMVWQLVSKKGLVSYIAFKATQGRRFSTFYEPQWSWSSQDQSGKAAHKATVRRMWDRIKQLAQRYDYAEQEKFSSFQNWPNSHYFLFGNNCHVFAGWAIRASGNTVPQIDGWKLGISSDPMPVMNIWAGRSPFLGDPAPPPPN